MHSSQELNFCKLMENSFNDIIYFLWNFLSFNILFKKFAFFFQETFFLNIPVWKCLTFCIKNYKTLTLKQILRKKNWYYLNNQHINFYIQIFFFKFKENTIIKHVKIFLLRKKKTTLFIFNVLLYKTNLLFLNSKNCS